MLGEYITQIPGIDGEIKIKPQDFYVEEIIDLSKFNKNGSNLIIKVKKINWDTLNFARVLSKILRISQKRIEYAGTKDKRSLSIQYFTIRNIKDDELERLKSIKLKDVEIEIIGRSSKSIKLGELIGNKFKIKLSNASNLDAIDAIYNTLLKKGIPNYFGLQRFGFRLITHEVGKLILKKEYSEAFWTYVAKPSENENPELRKIREEVWDSRDPKLGLREFPKELRYERFLLQKLREGYDEAKALLLLPKNLKMLFIHAYQSYIFNKLLSLRIKEFKNLKIVEKSDFVDFITFKNSYPTLADNPTEITSINMRRVKFLINQKLAYLALPLPGYEVQGSGWSFDKLKDMLENDGISFSNFKHEYSEFSSKGSYRVADMPLWDFKYEVVDNNSVIFSFFIPKGCYATVLLREFTKKDFF